MPSAARSRRCRVARVSTAIWSLIPSTSTTARAAAARGLAAPVAWAAALGPVSRPAGRAGGDQVAAALVLADRLDRRPLRHAKVGRPVEPDVEAAVFAEHHR